jgi:hypothetical protein
MILQVNPESALWVKGAAATILFLHIGGGSVGIVSGVAALTVKKGSRLHRLAGNTFFISMLIMSFIGAVVSPFLPTPAWNNVLAGIFTFYLVATSWMTVKRKPGIGAAEIATLIASMGIAIGGASVGIYLANKPNLRFDNGAGPMFMFSILAAIASLGDFRIILRGGITGAQRIARHLWRMCAALLIACASLFFGQPQLFSKSVHASGILFIPELFVIASLLFWLIRVRFAKHWRGIPANPS